MDDSIGGVGSAKQCWKLQRLLAFHGWCRTRVRIHPAGIDYREGANQDAEADIISISASLIFLIQLCLDRIDVRLAAIVT